MNLVKVQELIGPVLDWAVAKCEYDELAAATIQFPANSKYYPKITPSTDWSQGGPIIDRLGGFQLKVWLESNPSSKCEAHIHNYDGDWIAFGPTPLIAAMRCYVASKMGYEIQTPKELMLYEH